MIFVDAYKVDFHLQRSIGQQCALSPLSLRQAAIDGLGLAMFPDFFVEDELADGRLVPVLA